jgi:hypothetical protein
MDRYPKEGRLASGACVHDYVSFGGNLGKHGVWESVGWDAIPYRGLRVLHMGGWILQSWLA